MKTRVIAGLCMVPLLAILYFGGWALGIAWVAIAAIGVTEFYKGFENLQIKPYKYVSYGVIAALFVLFAFSKNYSFDMKLYPYLILMILVLGICAAMIFGWKINEKKAEDTIATVIGIVYVVFFSYHLVMIDVLSTGHIFLWTVVLSAFGSDICAYFTGMKFGKKKLAPNLSPKKTIEGSIGGVAGAGILCLLFGLIFAREYILQCLIIGIVGGAVSQAGDLTASAFKRKMGIKDYGKLIPGHGGIMDRFDSVIFVAPFVFYLVLFMVEYRTYQGW